MALTSKANEMRQNGEDVIVLTVGEPDFDTPQYIKDAAKIAIDQGMTKYTSVDGTVDLKQSIINKFKQENNLHYEMDEIIVSAGCKQSIFNLLQVLIDDGDEVIIPQPYWVSYADMVVYSGGKPVLLETQYDENFEIDPDQLEKLINDKTKLFMLNSPNNPSGKYFGSKLLGQLGKVLEKYKQVYISSDDIYEHIHWHKEKFQNMVNVCPNLKDRTIVLNGVSKAYSMTGWRIGYAAGNREVIKKMKTLQSQSTSCASSISQAAACAALSSECQELPIMTAEYKKRHDYVVSELNKISGVTCKETDGTFYVFPSFIKYIENSKTIDSDRDLALHLLNVAKVAVVPGSAFGTDGHIRISIAIDINTLKEAMKRLSDAL
ncbi:MAG: pyridoxal phosphate-dependent aminotransferase [Gammaproteobacteria bacterium]|jgi:aspartate aminotransferase|nr:pyridoxal phosphate-dependent aminotransferase [Gammaproteobacteria bacterium]MBT4461939.1 pyridoxal phosphate-dependent aminotransferase [Gammaproteobacteria bacterium]MBT4655140.1 pyridoxal phosphate-dependent aminotransferase [Gammaproteobacteria bacterium]MBT5116745.1 pyridoxal phosphate-dependent aminotransferase [Gammaproteobacteria bacterium]MBT5761392.1 pyridoxal phosphate-dependent aminotransferase [Gammaproteobacteria bacterium]